MTKAAAVQTRPSTSSAPIAAPDGVAAGGAAAANGVSSDGRDREARAHRRARVGVGERPAEDHRAGGVARGGDEDRARAEQLVRAPGDVDADERDDAAEADQQPDEAPAGDALARVEAQREERDDQRRGGDDDRRDGRVDVLLAGGDQRERHGDLEHGEQRQPAAPAAQRPERPGAPGEEQQHRGAEDDARPREERGRDAVVDSDLDEQVRDAPDRRHREEPGPRPRTHRARIFSRRAPPPRGDRRYSGVRNTRNGMTRFGPVVRKCRRWSSCRVHVPECSSAAGTGTRRARTVSVPHGPAGIPNR